MSKKKGITNLIEGWWRSNQKGRIFVMAQGLQMEDILAHPLGPLPWSLATADGLLRKTNKASAFQKDVPACSRTTSRSLCRSDWREVFDIFDILRIKSDLHIWRDSLISTINGTERGAEKWQYRCSVWYIQWPLYQEQQKIIKSDCQTMEEVPECGIK